MQCSKPTPVFCASVHGKEWKNMKLCRLLLISAVIMLAGVGVNAHGLPQKGAVYEDFEGGGVFNDCLEIVKDSDGNSAARIKNTLTDTVYTPVKNMTLEGKFFVEEMEKNSLFEIIPTSNPRGDTYYGGNRDTIFSLELSGGFMRIGRYTGPDVEIKEGWNSFSVAYLGDTAFFEVNGTKMCATLSKGVPGIKFRAEGASVLIDDLTVAQIRTGSPTTLAVMNPEVTVSAYEPYDFIDGSGICLKNSHYAANQSLDDVTYTVSGDYKELSKGYGYFYSDSVVTFKNSAGKTCTVNIRVDNKGMTKGEYLNSTIYKRRRENTVTAYETYRNGVPKSGATYSHLFYMLSPSVLYPQSEAHDEEIEFFTEMAENTVFETRGSVGAEDFIAIDLILLAGNEKLNISDELKERLKSFFLSLDLSDPEEGLSENHRITYYAIAIAALELYGNEIFFNGLSAEENKELYKGYISEWIDFRMKYGMGEYDSPGYSIIDFAALETIYTKTNDGELKRRVYEMLMYLYTDIALDSNNAVLGGAVSRTYINALKTMENPALDILFDNYIHPEHSVSLQMLPFSCSEFVPQRSLAEFCADRTESYPHAEKRRIYTIPDDNKLMYMLTKYAYVTPDYIIGSLVECDPLPKEAYKKSDKYYIKTGTYSADTRILPDFQSVGFSISIKGNSLLNIIDSHPGGSYNVTNASHAYFSGDHGCRCARYGQHENTVLSIRHITNEKLPQFSHFYINQNEFDEVIEKNGWIVLRSDNVYAALYPIAADGSGYSRGSEEELFAKTPLSQLEIKINCPDSAFVAEVYSEDEAGDFKEFCDAITENKPVFNDNTLEYTSYYGDVLKLSYDTNELIRNGTKKTYTGSYTDYTKLYVTSPWGKNDVNYKTFKTPYDNYAPIYKKGANTYRVQPMNKDGRLYVAVYDEAGRLYEVKEISEETDFTIADGNSIKAIVLDDDGITPLVKL